MQKAKFFIVFRGVAKTGKPYHLLCVLTVDVVAVEVE